MRNKKNRYGLGRIHLQSPRKQVRPIDLCTSDLTLPSFHVPKIRVSDEKLKTEFREDYPTHIHRRQTDGMLKEKYVVGDPVRFSDNRALVQYTLYNASKHVFCMRERNVRRHYLSCAVNTVPLKTNVMVYT